MQIASTATASVLTDPTVATESAVMVWHLLVSLLAQPELALVLPAVGGMFDLGGKGESEGDDVDGDDVEDADTGFAGDGDDGMDGMDDWDDLDDGDDDWAEDAGGTQVGELEDKVNSLETDLSAVSSSMETVKEENRQLAETVEEADETIRKLLDVYEIVTRGINPFVDDAEAMAAADGSFGLFGDQASEEPIDPEIAGADAESFFDDDFDDFDDFGEEADEATEGDEDDEGGGASFDELKAEYDADDGSWEDVVDEEGEEEVVAPESDEDDLDDEAAADLLEAEGDDEDAWGEEPGLEGEDEPESEPEPDAIVDEQVPEPEPEPTPTPLANGNGSQNGHAGRAGNGHARDDRPYLAAVPTGYAAEVVLLDWARHLVDEGDAAGAVDAFRHYERLGWISEPVRRRLATLATELCDAPTTSTVELGPEHHRRSLEYVSRLAGRPVTGGLIRERDGRLTGGP
ncbi:hypothetical protein N0B31_12560 [Salinirubellus salinus]|uniref:Archaeal flagella protein FlaD/E domain-containing protein n=1 Tax=Salinirubellus salinus TaxID=1364945 RepID=A0A9E7U702_9EURY|nr:FlaD/FlaE family flagellar protein [Salinirubellus salinus]UWM52981.1 hypothetical protein N0B31_12560 [Salinirubellus salinus]